MFLEINARNSLYERALDLRMRTTTRMTFSFKFSHTYSLLIDTPESFIELFPAQKLVHVCLFPLKEVKPSPDH